MMKEILIIISNVVHGMEEIFYLFFVNLMKLFQKENILLILKKIKINLIMQDMK